MPRTRVGGKARRRLRVADVGLREMLNFACGWEPPTTAFARSRTPWLTWTQFLTDWAAVREEWLAHPEAVLGKPGETPFAERIYQRFGPDGPPVEMTYTQLKGVTK